MAIDDEARELKQHRRPPTPEEVLAFKDLYRQVDRAVLMPLVVNGQDRYAVALLRESGTGKKYLQVLAVLLHPDDDVWDQEASEQNNLKPLAKQYLN